MRPSVPTAGLVIVALAAASCGGAGSAGATASTPGAEAYVALCSVRADAEAGDLAAAEATFEDDVHETLHHLADDVGQVDRQAAGALLEAKSEVEADLARDRPGAATTADHVGRLLEAMADALRAAEIEVPTCGGGST